MIIYGIRKRDYEARPIDKTYLQSKGLSDQQFGGQDEAWGTSDRGSAEKMLDICIRRFITPVSTECFDIVEIEANY